MAYSDQQFEDELRETIGKDAPLPPEMNWEAMREGVNQKMTAKRKKKRPLLVWWWPGVGLILLLIVGVIGYQLQPSIVPPEEAPSTTDPKAVDHIASQPASVVDATEKSRAGHKTDLAIAPPTERPELQFHAVSNAEVQAKTDQKALPKFRNSPQQLIATAFTTSPTNPPSPFDDVATTNEIASGPTTNMQSSAKALAMLPFISHPFVVMGDFLPLLPLNVTPNMSKETPQNAEAITRDSPSEPEAWFIDALAGTQFSPVNYRGDSSNYATLRSDSERALLGHHFSLGIGKNIGQKWQLRSGLAYDRVRTLTDYEAIRTFDSTFLNVPQQVINGDTIFATAQLQVTETRELKSYQREQRLSIPLLLGRNFRIGNNSLTVRAGPEFGLLIGSGGNVLAADQSTRILSDEDFQRLSIIARLEGELGIPLGGKGPLLIGRIGFRRVLGSGPGEVHRQENSVVGGIGFRWSLK